MNGKIKALVRSSLYAARYRGCSIGNKSFVRSDSQLDGGVHLGANAQVSGARLSNATFGAAANLGPQARVFNSQFGNDCRLEARAQVYSSTVENWVTLGADTEITEAQIGSGSYIAAQTQLNKVTVGRFTSIGPRCLAGTGEHPTDFVSTSPVFYSTLGQSGLVLGAKEVFVERKPVVIGHDVWIGAQVFVRDGVTIGDGAIIAAGAIVNKDVAPYTIVGGVPAKPIRARFPDEHVRRLLALQWWHWDEARLRAAQPLMAQTDIEKFLCWAEMQDGASS